VYRLQPRLSDHSPTLSRARWGSDQGIGPFWKLAQMADAAKHQQRTRLIISQRTRC
jgi:hypothetical protein